MVIISKHFAEMPLAPLLAQSVYLAYLLLLFEWCVLLLILQDKKMFLGL